MRKPSAMSKSEFVETFGGVFEHSPWIAERAWESGLGQAHDSAGGLHDALRQIFRSATAEERLAVIKAHPDLAGRLAAAKRLTPESAREQASAGLDALTEAQLARFTELNAAYTSRFGFPFILAVKGRTKEEILRNFDARIGNDRQTELETACAQVEEIARLRLRDMLPD
jgi:OHCU decarboxylase